MATLTPIFERLVAEHRQTVFRICRSILRDEHLSADAAQDAYLRLWRRLRGSGLPEKPHVWLRRAAASSALDLIRRRDARHEEPAPLGETPATTTPLETHAAADELDAQLRTAVLRLPEGQRTVFLLRHDGGLSLREISETLDLALPTIKTQFARACLKLQTRLAAFRPDRSDAS